MKIIRSKTFLLASLAMVAFSSETAIADNEVGAAKGTRDTQTHIAKATQSNADAPVRIADATVRTADLRSAEDDSDRSGLFGSVETSWNSAGGPRNFLVALSPDDNPSGSKERRMHPMLSEDQMKKMVALKDQYRIDVAAKQAEVMALHHKMGDLLSEASINRKAVTDLHGKIAALNADLAQQHLKFVLDSSEIFTPEQRSKMHAMMLRHQSGPPPFGPAMPPPMMPVGGHMFGGPEGFGPPPFGAPAVMGFLSPGMGPHHGPPPPPPGFGFGKHPGGGGQNGCPPPGEKVPSGPPSAAGGAPEN